MARTIIRTSPDRNPSLATTLERWLKKRSAARADAAARTKEELVEGRLTIKRSEADFSMVSGTIQQGEITATYADLTRVFGKPTIKAGPRDLGRKTVVEWWVFYADGTRATIYDWKGILYDPKEWGIDPWRLNRAHIDEYLKQNVHWIVGGTTPKALGLVRAALRQGEGRTSRATGRKKKAPKGGSRRKKKPSLARILRAT